MEKFSAAYMSLTFLPIVDANLTLFNICVLDQDQAGFSYVFVTDHVRSVSRARFVQLIKKYPGCGQDDYSGNDVEGTFLGYASNCHAVTMATAIKKTFYGQVCHLCWHSVRELGNILTHYSLSITVETSRQYLHWFHWSLYD